jgi:CheY-like chemotaxis protein
LKRSCPDVLLLDQRLEGPLTGIQTAATARRRGFDVPILLFSAYLDDEARGDAERLRLMAVSKLDFPAIVRHVNAAYRLARAEARDLRH